MVESAFGTTLRKRREEHGLSLRKFAKLISYSPGWLSRIENGQASPTLQMARLCDRNLCTWGEFVALAQNDGADTAQPVHQPAQIPWSGEVIGRCDEYAFLNGRLEHHLSDDLRLFVCIEGGAGAGKSALATSWANRASGYFEDGILFADLRGFSVDSTSLSASEVLYDFLLDLGTPPERVPDSLCRRASLFRTLTSDRRLLIVLDNAVDSAQVEPLLPSGRDCGVIVTSRRRLPTLAIRHGAVAMTLGPLAQEDSFELLCSFGSGTPSDPTEQQATRSIADQCGHLPLALCIAGYRLATYRPACHLAPQTQDPTTWLDLLSSVEDPGLSVRAALDRSYAELQPRDARVYRMLALHPAGVTTTSLAALGDMDTRESLHALEHLADLHLVRYNPPGSARYQLGELEAIFAAEKLTGAEAPAL